MLGVWGNKFCKLLKACKKSDAEKVESLKFRALLSTLAATQEPLVVQISVLETTFYELVKARVLIASHDTNDNGRLENLKSV